ncbi:ABC transporter substrate-binding protein [Spongisporangium articulatum]|uniref:ABC transporter substrate-binding protein n=1 Tax=Spongisporangium articulatum TaxID=3362603 RepID=A0ABW8AJ78_9ACTN
MNRNRLAVVAAVALSALALTACGGSDALSTDSGSSPAAADTITVGSANFPENILLAEIYAGALEAKGVKVSKKLNIGSREVYLKALQDGSIDLLPEYNGYLLQYYDKNAGASTPEQILADLKTKLPATLTVLDQSTAEDTDGLVVTKATADKYKLKSIADLAPYAKNLTLGGPAEWKTRATGVPGLKAKYGLTFKKFVTLDAGGPVTVKALKNGRVDATNLFTTDPSITQNGFVLLSDPNHVFLNANVVPVITKSKVTPTVSTALNAVSAKLTTETLTELMQKVAIDKQDTATVAKEWLTTNGLA